MRILCKIVLTMLVAVHSTFTFAQQDPTLQTVMAEGVGTTIDTALQNAAQNALTNVVGSFIDANKILEKRVQINEGIREQTTFIRNDIKEYSQGWIKNIQVLESSSETGLFRVTAKVTIKNEAFKIFAKKLAQSEASVDQGLFSAMAVEIKQGENLKKILNDVVSPLLLGEVYDFKISTLRPIRDIDDKNIGGYYIEGMTNKFDRSKIVYFDVDMDVKKEYKNSFVSVLQSTANKQISLGLIHQHDGDFDGREKSMQNERSKLADDALGNSVIYLVNDGKVNAYIFDIPKKKFDKDFPWAEYFKHRLNDFIFQQFRGSMPILQVKLLNGNGEEIVAHRLAYPHIGFGSNDYQFAVVMAPRSDKEDCRYPCYQPLIGTGTINTLRFPVIDLDTKKIRVFLAIGDKERASRKIVVEFVQ